MAQLKNITLLPLMVIISYLGLTAGCDSFCMSYDECHNKFDELNAAGYEYIYNENHLDVPSGGCFIKKFNVYWGDGSDDEITEMDLPGERVRVCCDGDWTEEEAFTSKINKLKTSDYANAAPRMNVVYPIVAGIIAIVSALV